MVVHWYKLKGPGWRRRAIMNGVGAVATAVVAGMHHLATRWVIKMAPMGKPPARGLAAVSISGSTP